MKNTLRFCSRIQHRVLVKIDANQVLGNLEKEQDHLGRNNLRGRHIFATRELAVFYLLHGHPQVR